MIYALFNKGLPVHLTSESPYTGTPVLKTFMGVDGKELPYDQAKDGRDFKSFEEVEQIAKHFNEHGVLGRDDKPTFLGFDSGEWTSPRFGIMEAPKVGDKVSYAFNGDYYPCGEIVKITKGWRITTSTGKVFNRPRKVAPGWLMVGGTWRLVSGHMSEQNPSF